MSFATPDLCWDGRLENNLLMCIATGDGLLRSAPQPCLLHLFKVGDGPEYVVKKCGGELPHQFHVIRETLHQSVNVARG